MPSADLPTTRPDGRWYAPTGDQTAAHDRSLIHIYEVATGRILECPIGCPAHPAYVNLANPDWAQAAETVRRDAEAIEARRTALAEREGQQSERCTDPPATHLWDEHGHCVSCPAVAPHDDDARPAADAGRADEDDADGYREIADRHLREIWDEARYWPIRERDSARKAVTALQAQLAEVTRERDGLREEVRILTHTDSLEEVAMEAALTKAKRERDEARAKAVDGGEWTKTYGWRFRDGSPGSVDGLPTRSGSPTGRLVATEQDHWHGPVRDREVEPVTDDGSAT